MDAVPSPDSARTLRAELLNAGLIDWVSMSEADGRAARCCPEFSSSMRREFLVETLQEMVEEGLFVAGSLDTSDGRFAAFDESLQAVVTRIRNTYVDHNEDTSQWVFRFWFDLTDKGAARAEETERGREISHNVRQDMHRLFKD